MTLHLLRHAHAGDRSRWHSDDDLERPLTDTGLEQAHAIDQWFSDRPVRAVWSSFAVRCRQTVEPLAHRFELDIEGKAELTEGARPTPFLELLRDEALLDDDLVVCSHGDLIPEVLNTLLREGMSIIGGRGCEKGSIWSLDVRGRDIVSGTYTARP
ncbi:MAG: phosphoglycerate mutase family protein [Actinomycetota bacterium]